MKYIKTKLNRIEELLEEHKDYIICGFYNDFGEYIKSKMKYNYILKQANTIEELCDCYSYGTETARDLSVAKSWKNTDKNRNIYGCILTDEGIIYVAKMNDKGELELL